MVETHVDFRIPIAAAVFIDEMILSAGTVADSKTYGRLGFAPLIDETVNEDVATPVSVRIRAAALTPVLLTITIASPGTKAFCPIWIEAGPVVAIELYANKYVPSVSVVSLENLSFVGFVIFIASVARAALLTVRDDMLKFAGTLPPPPPPPEALLMTTPGITNVSCESTDIYIVSKYIFNIRD
jgi:hypothetical protein